MPCCKGSLYILTLKTAVQTVSSSHTNMLMVTAGVLALGLTRPLRRGGGGRGVLLDALGAQAAALAQQQALVHHPRELIGLRLAAVQTPPPQHSLSVASHTHHALH